MGKYINQINGNRVPDKGKVEFILKHVPTAVKVDPPTQWQEGLVCVVDNGVFEAAGYAYDEQEMELFLRPDMRAQRPRQWLVVPNAKELV